MISVQDSGVVYRNAKPHLRADHTWHPSVVRLDSGEFLVAFDRGQGAESLDYRTWICRSKDNGKSWSAPARIIPQETTRRSTHTVRIGRAADGTLVGLGARQYRDDPEEGCVNRANMGYVPLDVIQIVSRDSGQSWTEPQVVKTPLVGPGFEVCHSLVELKDGRWLWPTATWRGWDGSEPNGWKCVAFVSRDRGQTWSEFLDVINQWDQGLISWEVGLVQLLDSRLLAVVWAYHLESGQTHPTPYVVSQDGKTFSPPRLTGLKGQTMKLAVLKDGRVLALYRSNDASRPGLRAAVIRIDGDNWNTVKEEAIWTGASSGMEGKRNRSDELSALKFGYPQMVVLPDGEVFAVFWCMEDSIQNIRWLRIKVQ